MANFDPAMRAVRHPCSNISDRGVDIFQDVPNWNGEPNGKAASARTPGDQISALQKDIGPICTYGLSTIIRF